THSSRSGPERGAARAWKRRAGGSDDRRSSMTGSHTPAARPIRRGRPDGRAARRLWAALALGWAIGPGLARAQGPQVNVTNAPGVSSARGRLGPALGASGTSGFDATPVQPIQNIFLGRTGPGGTRAPLNQLNAPRVPVLQILPISLPQPLQPANIPQYGEL